MDHAKRILWLAVRFNRAAKGKAILLAVLIAVAMSVFLVVTELSRVSSEGLDEAISEDIGATGSYRIELKTSFGMSSPELAREVEKALLVYAAAPPVMIEVLPAITPECPPYEALGRQPILLMTDMKGDSLQLPFGDNLPVDTEICFDGQEIPASALYFPTRSEQARWGLGLVVDRSYREIVSASTNSPIVYNFSVVTGQRADQRQAIETTLLDQLEEAALRHGVDARDALVVLRVDSGESIRDASEGIKLVYALIGWGILMLGGLGLLVSELITVRNRTWFFGLARAVGASTRDIAALIFADIVLVLFLGTTLAILASLAIQPSANSFARQAFQIEVQLLQPSAIPQLLLGGLLVLAIAGVYPAVIATRQDPLDVLEPKVS